MRGRQEARQALAASRAKQRALFLNKPVLLSYGAMLCEKVQDVPEMRLNIAFGSCKPSHGGWGIIRDFNGGVGSGLVQLDNGESGWMANHHFETCDTVHSYQRYIPDPIPSPHCTSADAYLFPSLRR